MPGAGSLDYARGVVLTCIALQHEAGELIAAGLSEPDLVEIGTLYERGLDGSSWAPRVEAVDAARANGDVTIFKSVGVGVQDVAIACAVVDRAVREAIGRTIEGYDE